MIAVPSADPVGALVPHTLKEPLIGGSSGSLAGTSFMVKDLFAIKGRKVSNGSPDFYEHATPARETAPVITRLLEAGASCTGITVCDEFFYSVLGTNIHYGQPVNARAEARNWRLFVRCGCGGCRFYVQLRARHGHGRIDPRAGLVLRAIWPQADLRTHRHDRRDANGAEL